MSKSIKFCLALILLQWSAAIYAAGCQVTTSGGVSFSYDVFDASPADSESAITVTCDASTPSVVSVAIGISTISNSINPRQMLHISGTDVLSYNLFVDPSRTVIWGDDASGAARLLSNINDNVPRELPIYGRVFPGQDVSSGAYSDVVTVTIAP